MLKLLSKLYLRLIGWKIKGNFPHNIKKAVILFAPHTSFSDFYIGRAAFYILGINIKFLIKKEVFRFGIGPFLKLMGGIPVDRSRKTDIVDQIVEKLNNSEHLIIMVAPEGTRKLQKRWKKGYYYIALKAKVPIILGYMDYKKKEGGVFEVVYPSGDYEDDFKKIRDFYKGVTAKYPENFAVPEA